MSEREKRNKYSLLGENRIFPETNIYNSNISSDYYRSLSGTEKFDARIIRRTILNIVGVTNFSQIPELFYDEAKKQEIYKKFIIEYGNTYGIGIKIPSIKEISGKEEEKLTEQELTHTKRNKSYFEKFDFEKKESSILQALNNANDIIRFFENTEIGILRKYDTSIGQVNEIEAIKNPVDLLMICFSSKASKKMKFEARRKLALMDLTLKLNLEFEKQNNNMDTVLRYFNTHVWDGPIGETKKIEILTKHNREDYKCENISILEPNQKVELHNLMRYEVFDMREFQSRRINKQTGERIKKPAYFISRRKDSISAYLKALRLNTKDVEKITDHIGIRIVCINKIDCLDFIDSLKNSSKNSGNLVIIEDVQDTIENGEEFKGASKGSSGKTEMIKINLIISGVKAELQLHTLRTYLDSRYRDEVGAEEYMIKRLFDDGVVNLIYPNDIYGVDFDLIKKRMIEDRRKSVRISKTDIPENRKIQK